MGSNGRTPEAAEATVRSTSSGEVMGFVGSGGAQIWRGIPYGATTAGANRWRAPLPAPSWRGRRPCLRHAQRCAQLTNRGDEKDGIQAGLVVGSEACLALDIYAPPGAAEGAALPVMLWIHGGGNVWGYSAKYDGSTLAARERVIVVIPQYRVGLLGWFAHPALRAAAAAPEDRAACFATLDLIASLRWVADNIAGFGGDPECVTIFGESSGGHNVATLLASPLAGGLFHRAIIQSGSFDSVPLAEAEGIEGDFANPSRQIAERLGAQTADDLRAASVEQLYEACDIGESWLLDVPRVIADGVVLPATPLREAFTSTETFHRVPIITGTNRDEMKLFFGSRKDMITKKFGFLPVPRDQHLYDATARYLTRAWRIRSVDEPASAMIGAGHDTVYSYRFDWDDGGRFLAMDFGTMFGAAHGFEIPFVFGRFEHLGDADRFLFTRRTRTDRERLSQAIGHYWASFARDGHPTCPDRPDWPRYRPGQGPYLRLDTDNDGGIGAVAETDSVDRLAANLAGDPTLDDLQRRSIVAEMGNWLFTRPIQAHVRAVIEGRPPQKLPAP
jgi:para-nitrobenzyl esterase